MPHRPLTILDTVLDHIGNTPCVRINRIGAEEGLECEIVAKCEYFNSGGSVKDRIGKKMVEAAEKEKRIGPGYTLIEPTSGNTGIGLALCGAVKGYRTIITLPEKMSQEKVDVLKALGAEIIRTPTEAAWDSPESHIGVAKRLNNEIPNSVILDQYGNPNNPLAHYEHTAEEIIEACNGKVDMFVAGAGTGGTVAGVAKKLKEKCPGVIIVGVDPNGSILAQPEALNDEGVHSYKVEGIGYDFIPQVLDRSLVDFWVKTDDKESFIMSRKLIRQEGLLCGGSCGSAMVGAIKAIKHFKFGKDKRVVVLLPDSVRNYMSKFLNDEWMKKNGFTDEIITKEEDERKMQFQGATIKDLDLPVAVTVSAETTCKDALTIMKSQGFDQLPVTVSTGDKHLVGLITLGTISSKLLSNRIVLTDPVSKAMFKFERTTTDKFRRITPSSPLETLSKFFEKNSCAVVTGDGNDEVKHVVTKIDLLTFLMRQNGSV